MLFTVYSPPLHWVKTMTELTQWSLHNINYISTLNYAMHEKHFKHSLRLHLLGISSFRLTPKRKSFTNPLPCLPLYDLKANEWSEFHSSATADFTCCTSGDVAVVAANLRLNCASQGGCWPARPAERVFFFCREFLRNL